MFRVSCFVIRENLLVGVGAALLGVAAGTGKIVFRASWMVKTQQAVLPVRGTTAAHAAP